MIQHPAFVFEPWALHETALDLDRLAQTESLFALSNGNIGLRGNLDEGEPHVLPGTYLNGFFESRPMPYAEAGFGFPESDHTLINVADGKLLRLLVDGEAFDVRTGTLRAHERVQDFRAGMLVRTVEWRSPAGHTVRITSSRLVSLTQRAVVAIRYRIEPLGGPIDVVIQSELAANEQLPMRQLDPRAAQVFEAPLDCEYVNAETTAAALVHRTKRSGLRTASAMTHVIEGSKRVRSSSQVLGNLARITISDAIPLGHSLCVTKFIAYGWSSDRGVTALKDKVATAIETARSTGWHRLIADQRRYLDAFWERADVEVEGNDELQQAVRFALFHVLQAGARIENCGIPAKGLTGPGYDGHSFWDTATFILPLLTNSIPAATAQVLRWRQATLGTAKRRANQLGLAGAAFPWRSINGEECSGYWPAGTAAFHVNADIADAIVRYVNATGDSAFERDVGIDILTETARLWISLGHYDSQGAFRIDGVTGPDEYSAISDNNLYTNLMAKRNLRAAALACERHWARAEECTVARAECAAWQKAAQHMFIAYNRELRVHEQSQGFTSHEKWNFATTRTDQYPLMLHFHYFDLYRKQVVKQPDLVLAMQLCSDEFSAEEKARNFAYYEQITVRDSSLSASSEAVLAAEVGHLQLALDYALEAALIDLDNLEQNVRDGLHLASLAGAWTALVAGFGGVRDHGDILSFAPRLPEGLTRLSFTLLRRDMPLQMAVTARSARYRLLATHDTFEISHYGERIRLRGMDLVERDIPPLVAVEPVRQPPGREPSRSAYQKTREARRPAS
jgi:alpha,alpha-trehalose phosphorylase